MNIQPSIDLKKVNLQTAVGYLISLHENEYQWNLLGVKVIGVAATEADIPVGTYEYGDAYEVGTKPPYDLYIYTRPDGVVHTEGYWFNTGKFPMPGPQGPKGDGLEQVTKWTNGTVTGVTYDATNGAEVSQTSTVNYTDSTDGSAKQKQFDTTTTLPIVPGKYISMNATSDNKKMEVKVDDTALALDYIKLDKTKESVIPQNNAGVLSWLPSSTSATKNSLVQRDANGNGNFNKITVTPAGITIGSNNFDQTVMIYGLKSDLTIIDQSGGTLTNNEAYVINTTAACRLKIQDKVYYRVSELGKAPIIFMSCGTDGTIYVLTCNTSAKTYAISTFASSTTHNLTLTNSSTGISIYFTLTNGRPETYEYAPADLWSALENKSIACSLNISGAYSAGIITTEGDNFKVFYGNIEEMTITQTEMTITDSLA